MRRKLLSALLLLLGLGANAQSFTEGQDVTDQLGWTNPSCMGSGSVKDWSKKGNVECTDGDGRYLEMYCWGTWNNNVGTEMYQTFELPAGVYEFAMQGYYRHGINYNSHLENTKGGTVFVNGASFFVETGVNADGTKTSKFKNNEVQTKDLWHVLSAEKMSKDDGQFSYADWSKWYPKLTADAATRINADMCTNTLVVKQPETGYIRVGIRRNANTDGSALNFGKFKATYLRAYDSNEMEIGEDITSRIAGFNALDMETIKDCGWTIESVDPKTSESKGSSLNQGPTLEAWADWSNNNRYQTTIYKEITLPEGIYELHTSGFYRASVERYEKDLKSYREGNKVHGADFFAKVGEVEYKTELADIYECASQTLRYTGWWYDSGDDGEAVLSDGTYYYPKSQNGARCHIWNSGLCDNKLIAVVPAGGSTVRIGVRKLTGNYGDGVNFRDIKIIYLGSSQEDVITAQKASENTIGWISGKKIVAPANIVTSRLETGFQKLAAARSVAELNDAFSYLVAVRNSKIGKTIAKGNTQCNSFSTLSAIPYSQKAEYGTLIVPFDAALATGMTGYSCSEVVDNVLSLTEVTGSIENKPMIVSANTGDYIFVGYGDAQTLNVTEGYLTGIYDAETEIPQGSYILTKKNDVLGFYVVDQEQPKVAANKCYLTVPAAQANLRGVFFNAADAEATAIKAIDTKAENAVIFNAAGQRMDKMQKGINIVNGKKYFVK